MGSVIDIPGLSMGTDVLSYGNSSVNAAMTSTGFFVNGTSLSSGMTMIFGIDLNNLKGPGIYACSDSSCTNGPVATGQYYVEVIVYGLAPSAYLMQRVTDLSFGVTYIRVCLNSIWSTWRQFVMADIPFSHRNIIGRNGGMEVWQRGTSISVLASTTVYTLDGWYCWTNANQACTVSRVTGLTSNSRFAAKFQRNSGQTGVVQIAALACPLDADELIKILGNSLCLSFTMKAGANISSAGGSVGVYLATGTGGSPAKRGNSGYTGESGIISALVVPSTTAQRFTLLSAQVTGNINQAELQFYYIPVGTAGADDGFTVDDVQLEIIPTGQNITSATTFERTDYLYDLQRCQRHLFVGAIQVPIPPVQNLRTLQMRAVPTITGGGAGFVSTGTTADSLIGSQTTAAAPTLTLSSEI